MKILLFAILGAMSLSACAEAPEPEVAGEAAPAAGIAATPPAPAPAAVAGTPDARAIEAVRTVSPQAAVDHVGAAPIPGFREVLVGGQVAYVSDDGKYLFIPGQGGALYDVGARRDLTEASIARQRIALLEAIPASERIVFAPAKPVHTVTVFTDITCGYCRKLHSEIAEYNRQGIAIEYLAFPRQGPASQDFRDMVSIWCAPDRRKAMTDAKNGKPVPKRDCTTTVAQQYDVGQRAGLTGTPMIITADGTQVGGYLPPDRLRQVLDELAARDASPAASS